MSKQIGALIIDLMGKELIDEESELLAHPLIGGVILFTRNYESRQQLEALCQRIRAARKDPLLIMVDQEGGRVQRFIPEFTRLPSAAQFGKIYDKNADLACVLSSKCGWLMATELLSMGVDLSLAPLLDLNKNISSVIGDRAFHSNPEAVIQLATVFMQGMAEAGMAATGKHFPGHGSVLLDSHVACPIDKRSLKEIEFEDMQPFVGLIKAGIPAMMAAHIVFQQVDDKPVGYSRIWLQEVLRTRLGFQGIIFSDDLNMEGANISDDYADRVIAARDAGCDFALLCNNRPKVIQVLDRVSSKNHQVSEEKWRTLRGLCLANEPLSVNKQWQETHQFLREAMPL